MISQKSNKHDSDEGDTRERAKHELMLDGEAPRDCGLESHHYAHPIADKLIQIARHVISTVNTTPLSPPLLQCDLFRGEVKICCLRGIWDDVLHPEPDSFVLYVLLLFCSSHPAHTQQAQHTPHDTTSANVVPAQ